METKLKKSVMCYEDINNAIERMHLLKPEYPEARVVCYTPGYAVQYRISGPYYPQLENTP